MAPVDARLQRYYDQHSAVIEDELGQAVDRAIYAEAPDPLSYIATEVLVSRGTVDKRQLHSIMNASANGPSRHELDLKNAVNMARERMFGTPEPDRDADDPRTFEARQWLASIDLLTLIDEALLEPLRQHASSPAMERDYIVALGKLNDPSPIVATLEKALHHLGERIHLKARELDSSSSMASEDFSDQTSKFFDGDGGGDVLTFGEQAYFDRGLDKFIGPPKWVAGSRTQGRDRKKRASSRRMALRSFACRAAPIWARRCTSSTASRRTRRRSSS